jgi:hypothetical protein
MKIGFIKLGLKTYFEKSGTGQGSNHELVDVFNIFQNNGHECHMLSNSDKYSQMKIGKYDWIFVFNGFAPTTWQTNMNMFKGSLDSLTYLKEHKNIPYAYFWTDPRYDISKNPLFKEVPPTVILSQEPNHYAHLDKLILYHKDAPLIFAKDKFFTIMMNDTGEKERKKSILNVTNWLQHENYKCDVYGNWPKNKELNARDIPENEVSDYLSRYLYAFNAGKNPNWVSQKYWEMVLANVICFHTNYDISNLIMHPKDFKRVLDGIDVIDKIEQLQSNPELYEEIINAQKNELKSGYYTGEFIYQIIMEKIKCI